MRLPRLVVLVVLAASCSGGGGDGATAREAEEHRVVAGGKIAAPAKLAELSTSSPVAVVPDGALNPTTAYDPKSKAIYVAWAEEIPGAAQPDGKDQQVRAVVARSDDGGKTFSAPVVASGPDDHVRTYTISPTQVVVGPGGEVYVQYLHNVPSDASDYLKEYGRSSLRVVRSDDGGKTFSPSADIAGEAVEGVVTTMEMATLFAAPDGDLYVTFLDEREAITADIEGRPKPDPHDHDAVLPATQMRLVRSADGGKTWSRSVLVAKPTCGCCSTKAAQGQDGPLFASTRSDWKELKGSYDSVRDVFVAASTDDGATWAEPKKVFDDKFKISGCPDVHNGLQVDSKGRLHTAWYTGAESHPGVYYAMSSDGGQTFTPPLELMGDKWIPYGDVKLSIDGQGQPWVVFEDRRTDEDQIRLVRIDPDQRAASFSASWPGTAPDVAAGEDWAVVTWATPAGEGDDVGGPVQTLVAKPGTT
ncbi:MAG: sialidase family protein [Acidimicrobiia bacterium]